MGQDNEVQVSLRVAELLCSRLCHDLIGPTSAVNTGLELIGESDPDIVGQAMGLVRTSAAQATGKLEFFRLAFGFGDGGGAITVAQTLALFGQYWPGGRAAVSGDERTAHLALALPRPASRLLTNLLMIGADCLPRGGEIDLEFARVDAGLAVVVSATGAQVSISDDRRLALNPTADQNQLTARSVQAFFATKLADILSTRVELDCREGDYVRLATVLPA